MNKKMTEKTILISGVAKDFLDIRADAVAVIHTPFNELCKCPYEVASKFQFFVAQIKEQYLDNLKLCEVVSKAIADCKSEKLKSNIYPTVNLINFTDVYVRLSCMTEYKSLNPEDLFDFAVEYTVTAEMVKEMFEIAEKQASLKLRYDNLKACVLLDAELANDGTLFNGYEIITEEGIITVTDKYGFDAVRAGHLKEMLKDHAGDLIEQITDYKVKPTLVKTLTDLSRGLIGDISSTDFLLNTAKEYGEVFKRDAKNYTDEKFIKKMKTALKKEYKKNAIIFSNLLGTTEELSAELAIGYYKAEAYDEFLKLLIIAGVDPTDDMDFSMFKQSLKATYTVSPTSAFTLKALNN